MRQTYNHTDFVSAIDLQAPDLHDFRDLPKARPNRLLVAVIAVAAVLTAGHLVHSADRQVPDTRATVETVSNQG